MKWITKMILFITLLLKFIICMEVSAETFDRECELKYTTNLVWDSSETIKSRLKTDLLIEYALPSSVSLKDTFPVPREQGEQDSCAAWAVAYALMSHQEEEKRNWGLHDDSHLFSPAYVYNQRNNGVDEGISIGSAMELLVEEGVSTLASFPYSEFDYYTQPTVEQREEALHFRVENWYTIQGIDDIKNRLLKD